MVKIRMKIRKFTEILLDRESLIPAKVKYIWFQASQNKKKTNLNQLDF